MRNSPLMEIDIGVRKGENRGRDAKTKLSQSRRTTANATTRWAIPNFKWRFVRLMRRVPVLKRLAASADLRTPGVRYAVNPAIDRIVFICGLHRSGTTLLEDYIHAHFDVSCLRGSVPENEGQHLQDVYSEDRRFGGPGRFALSNEIRRELESLPAGDAPRERILQCWRHYMVGKSTTLLEKSPPNLTRIGWLRANFPGARFIVLVRDPRAVSAATLKWTSASVEELVAHWQAAHTIALSDADPRDTCFIRYEDFCADPERTLAETPVPGWLAKRPWPLASPARFAALTNSNARYLDTCKGMSFGPGVWERFGYDLGGTNRKTDERPAPAYQLAG